MWKYCSYSPLRISFAGGGTDIAPFVDEYGSSVVNATFDRGVMLNYREDQYPLEISSRDFFSSTVSGVHSERRGMPGKLVDLFTEMGITKGSVLISSDVPPGSGLGSSSALILGALELIHTIRGEKVERDSLAEEAYRVERDFFKITLGLQDPYAIAYGGFKSFNFDRNGISNSIFDLNRDFIRKFETSLLLVYTGKTRQSSRILSDQVRKSHQKDPETIEKLAAIKKLALEMKDAISRERYQEITSIINTGWEIKKSLGRDVTNDTVDGIIRAAMRNGADAARLLGGGSQGFVLLLSQDRIVELQKKMLNYSRFVVRVSFDSLGTRIIPHR